jgi:hypothetical protein
MTGVSVRNGGQQGLNRPGLPASDLFAILWDALADLLGTAATATLLKRAGRRASVRNSELAGLVIRREGLAYGYSCPPGWSGASPGTPAALRDLIEELRPLLVEMTGQLVIQHLEQVLELRERGLFTTREGHP